MSRRLPPARAATLALFLLYLAFVALYLWQAAQRLTPTIFSDELELAQISRSIAETGQSARRGEPFGLQSLYTVLLAPVWWLDDPRNAYDAAKIVGVLLMTATIFPAYGLARLVVSRPWALFAAAGAVAVPALAYAPFLLEEPLAYPVSTVALWLIARFAAAPSLAAFAPALAVCVTAAVVRSQLAILSAVLVLVLLGLGWVTARMRRWRSSWTREDWLGAGVLAVGGVLLLSAVLGHASESWYVTTAFWKGRLLEYGLWALGALAIGSGVLPLVGGLSALAARGEGGARHRAFVLTAVATLACFGMYTAVKAAYLSTVFATRVTERNLIYLAPVLFAGTALVLERPRTRWWAIGAAAALSLYLVVSTPYELASYPYGDSPSLAVAAFANRELVWDQRAIERALVVATLVAAALVAGRSLLRARPARIVGIAGAAAALAWSGGAEIYAARGYAFQSDLLHANLAKPVDWVDRATGGEPAVYLGQSIDDANGIWLLEFWNRTVRRVWSMDGTAPGPGPTLSPDLAAPDGTLRPHPGMRWVVAEDEVKLAARRVGPRRMGLQLYRLDGPLRLESSTSGIAGDGWMGSEASYTRYAAPGTSSRGFAKVFLTNSFCAEGLRSRVTVRVGPVVVRRNQPALGPGAQAESRILESCDRAQTFLLRARVPFRVEVKLGRTFVPAELDPRSSDLRNLGARPAFEFVPLP